MDDLELINYRNSRYPYHRNYGPHRTWGGATMITKTDTCEWRYDDYVWDTPCGNAFVIENGTPEENHMELCCYCGSPVEQRKEKEHDNQD